MVKDIKEAIKECTKFRSSEPGKKAGDPLSSFKLVYDAPTAQLEPIYFWLLDFMQDLGFKAEKITDNFTAAVGSGHFAEMGQRATRMQEEGMKILGAINQVVKSAINLIYDLKEFEIRLQHYEDAKSKEAKTKEAALLALKQIWLDNVDMKRGRGSIHQMTYELGFTTLRDAFMIANSIEEVEKMAKGEDAVINDQVKRILMPRVAEFIKWQELSEKELKKRYEIEKSYLKSQIETVKLYTTYARPYLKAAEELKQKGFEIGEKSLKKDPTAYLINPKDPALVNMFNTAMFEITLFGKREINLKKEVMNQKLPYSFLNKELKRKYFSIAVVSLKFRGIPQKVTPQNYGFGGRVEITFDSYALNEDEILLLKKILTKDDIKTAIEFAYQGTEESLKQLEEDIAHFIDDGKEEEKKEIKDEMNPFAAIWDIFRNGFTSSAKKEGTKEINDLKEIKKDDFIEKYIRKKAAEGAAGALHTLYDVYKKAHGHASAPPDGLDFSFKS